MKQKYLITHYYHSGFSVAGDDTLLVFDYWRGERGEVTEKIQLTPEMLQQLQQQGLQNGAPEPADEAPAPEAK